MLDKKLQLLAEHADFHVNINSVVGGGIQQSARRAGGRQARAGVGLHFDRRHHSRRRRPAAAAGRAKSSDVYHEMKALEKRSFTRINHFQDNIAHGKSEQWRCRAGARYLYICEDGLVHYCSQQRGYPGIPLENTRSQTSAASFRPKNPARRIAPYPACTRYPWSIHGAPRRVPR